MKHLVFITDKNDWRFNEPLKLTHNVTVLEKIQNKRFVWIKININIISAYDWIIYLFVRTNIIRLNPTVTDDTE